MWTCLLLKAFSWFKYTIKPLQTTTSLVIWVKISINSSIEITKRQRYYVHSVLHVLMQFHLVGRHALQSSWYKNLQNYSSTVRWIKLWNYNTLSKNHFVMFFFEKNLCKQLLFIIKSALFFIWFFSFLLIIPLLK